MNSGGGAGAAVDYPDYVKSIHSYMLTGYGYDGIEMGIYDKTPTYNSALASVERAISGIIDPNNPFSSTEVSGLKTAADPLTASAGLTRDDSIEQIGLMLNQFESVVDEFDNPTDVTALVDAFEEDGLPSHRRSLNNIAAAYYDAGAINSSGFIVAIAMAESERQKVVERFRAEITTKDRYSLADLYHKVFLSQLDYTKYSLVSQQDKQEADIEYHVRNLMWDADQYRVVANMLGSPAGSTLGREDVKANKMLSAIGGAASGAAIGAEIAGKSGQAWGIGIGAVFGGVAGLLSS